MKIAVVLGGNSMERDVSLASGAEVMGALRRRGHEVVAIDSAKGRIEASYEAALLASGIAAEPPEAGGLLAGDWPTIVERLDWTGIDVVFLALHGGYGEDGRIQAVLDSSGIAYTGSGQTGSATAMDKDLSKRLFLATDVPTPAWRMAPVDAHTIGEVLGWPVVVKPNRQGSTVGLSLVETADGLQQAIDTAGEYDAEIMVEQFIAGREITVGILDEQALAVGEIIPRHGGLFDYQSKYQTGGAEEIFPADLSTTQTAEVQRLGLAAHHALKLDSYSRVDFRMDPQGSLWCLEANTLPGLTSLSLLPKSAQAVGIGFDDLCERLCELALGRHSQDVGRV